MNDKTEILAAIDRAIERRSKGDALLLIDYLMGELAGRCGEIEREQWNARQDAVYDLLEGSTPKIA
jgi:hypothetical protein